MYNTVCHTVDTQKIFAIIICKNHLPTNHEMFISLFPMIHLSNFFPLGDRDHVLHSLCAQKPLVQTLVLSGSPKKYQSILLRRW